MPGPFYFAWVGASETSFLPEHQREDEDVFSFKIIHEEGQMPTMSVVVRDPHVGLLKPGRKQWAWLSYWDGAVLHPIFFGRLVAVPGNLNDDLVELQFITRALNFISLRQALADSLKVLPYYDPIFFDPTAQNDPLSVIEAYSKAFHVPRTNASDWTVSDILEGEDGVETFTQDDVLHESVRIDLRDVPMTAVRIDSNVNWRQTFRSTNSGGPILVTSRIVNTLTGQALQSQWPKENTDLGNGWRAAFGTGCTLYGGNKGNYTESGSFQDTNRKHNPGDCISATWNVSSPTGPSYTLSYSSQATYGNVNTAGGSGGPFSSASGVFSNNGEFGGVQDEGGGSNTASASSNWTVAFVYRANCNLLIEPTGESNEFIESASMTLRADLQATLSDPTAEEETEVLTLPGQDVGEPVLDVKAWTSIAGQSVALGTYMRPNQTPGPGGTSTQIAIVGGVAGTEPPLFSDILGAETIDGSVHWICTSTTIGDWQANAYMLKGTVICYEAGGGFFFLATTEGFTGGSPPNFNKTSGSSTNDNQVVWKSLGTGGPSISVPMGEQPGNVTRYAYFPTPRGVQSLQYLLYRARARIRQRARAVEITARVPFERGLELSCRKNAYIYADEIPGGVGYGKIIRYSLELDADTGDHFCEVTIGCAVGKGGSPIPSVDGTNGYVQAGYVLPGYIYSPSSVVSMDDVALTPPSLPVDYKGPRAPLSLDQAVSAAGWTGSVEQQVAALQGRVVAAGAGGTRQPVIGVYGAIRSANDYAAGAEAMETIMENNSVKFEMHLNAISGLHIETSYSIATATMVVPKQIDLEVA